jgi:signal transduction histidine kinase
MGMGILLLVGEELQSGLHTLSALSSQLQPTNQGEDLPRALLERAMTLPAVRGSALVLAERGEVRVVRGAGECASWEGRVPDAHAGRAAAQAMRERRPIVQGGNGTTTGHAWVAALPVLSGETARGALLVVGQARDPFAALNADFLVAIGRQFGAALENAELQRRLAARTADLERLAGLMVHQHEEERRRLSRELHDETAQLFAALNLQLGLLRESAPPAQAPRLDRALGLVNEGIRSIRSVTDRLRPPLLDDLGLVPALRGLIDEFVDRHGIAVRFDASAELPPLKPDAELALFRALQEALSNVARHAQATQVQVRLSQEAGGVTLHVHDDGQGLPAADATRPARALGGSGLEGMGERVSLLGGRLSVHSGSERGVEVIVVLPAEPGD